MKRVRTMLFGVGAIVGYCIVAVSCSPTSLEALSKTNERLFNIFIKKQDGISGQLNDIKTQVEELKRSSGSCEKYDDVKFAVETMDETLKDYCFDVTDTLNAFLEQLQQDECSTKNICHKDAICEDLIISYKCTCKPGFQGDGQTCADIDECRMGSHACHAHATCSNLHGTYSCKCNLGYYGNGYSCSESKRCQGDSDCHSSSSCVTSGDIKYCHCRDGFLGDDGYSCTDINECDTVRCPANSECRNTPGSYSCDCFLGYQARGDACEDIDECLGTNNCDVNAVCSNVIGGYECSCNAGYVGDGRSCRDMCPFTRVSDIGCLLFDTQNRNWTSAEENCREHGAQLYTAASSDIFDRLKQYLVNDIPVEIDDWTGIWIGIKEDKWTNGDAVPSNLWSSQYCPTSGQCCGSLLSGPGAFGLNKEPCDWLRPSICQWMP